MSWRDGENSREYFAAQWYLQVRMSDSPAVPSLDTDAEQQQHSIPALAARVLFVPLLAT